MQYIPMQKVQESWPVKFILQLQATMVALNYLSYILTVWSYNVKNQSFFMA